MTEQAPRPVAAVLCVPKALRVVFILVWAAAVAFTIVAPAPISFVGLFGVYISPLFMRIARAVYRRDPATTLDAPALGADAWKDKEGLLAPVARSGGKGSDAFAVLLEGTGESGFEGAHGGEEAVREYLFLRRDLRNGLLNFAVFLLALAILHAVVPRSDLGAAAFLLFGLLAASAVPELTARVRVGVGHDGVRVHSGRRARFFPFASVQVVELREGSLLLRAAGERIELITREPEIVGLVRALRSRIALRALEATLRRESNAARTDGDETARIELLERGGRGSADWLRALRAPDSAAYRGAMPTTTRLLEVIANPWIRPSSRAAAAARLATVDPAEAAACAARVATQTASPRLRIALHAISSGDDTKIAAALDELENEEAARAKRGERALRRRGSKTSR